MFKYSYKRLLLMSALLAAGVLWGCGGRKMTAPPPAAPPRPTGPLATGQILEVRTGTRVSFDELIHSLAAHDVVFIGEIHDNPDHHLIQIQILQALLDRWGGGRKAIGMEFFPRPSQETLDRYLLGGWTETEFLAAVDWEYLWGYDYHLYRPLMLAAREKSIRVLAINAPPGIVKKVAREGLSALSDHERAQIAREVDLGNAAHREFVQKAYGHHTHLDLQSFENFYAAQAVWEETMAETIAAHINGVGGKMVVFAGNGHIVHKFGIPERTARRIRGTVATVVPYPVGGNVERERDLADYLWLSPATPASSPGSREQIRPAPRM